jgi:hypothetical protein
MKNKDLYQSLLMILYACMISFLGLACIQENTTKDSE